jgi:hypothetical protein
VIEVLGGLEHSVDRLERVRLAGPVLAEEDVDAGAQVDLLERGEILENDALHAHRGVVKDQAAAPLSAVCSPAPCLSGAPGRARMGFKA